MKLWRQYGIAVSVAWILGVTSYLRYQELPKAQAYATHAYLVCAERQAGSSGVRADRCLENVSRDWDQWMNSQWSRIAWLALTPVAIGGLAAIAGILVYRRGRPGTMPEQSSE